MNEPRYISHEHYAERFQTVWHHSEGNGYWSINRQIVPKNYKNGCGDWGCEEVSLTPERIAELYLMTLVAGHNPPAEIHEKIVNITLQPEYDPDCTEKVARAITDGKADPEVVKHALNVADGEKRGEGAECPF